ncbi:MAG TPA: PqqD family protein [Acidimicrobiia bacterium]|nr:PqqD family protein [Acidimicrobiia bacterium]
MLLAVHGSSPIALRGTALAIWDAFAAPRSVDDVAQELATVYDVPLDSVRAEVVPLVQALHGDGLLAARPEPEAR